MSLPLCGVPSASAPSTQGVVMLQQTALTHVLSPSADTRHEGGCALFYVAFNVTPLLLALPNGTKPFKGPIRT